MSKLHHASFFDGLLKTFIFHLLSSYQQNVVGGGSDGDLETGDLEETDIEYDENVDGRGRGGGSRPTRANRHHQNRRGRLASNNRSASASQPDQYRYIRKTKIIIFFFVQRAQLSFE